MPAHPLRRAERGFRAAAPGSLLAALAAFALIAAPAALHAQDAFPSRWEPQTVNGVPRISLETLRSFYKFPPEQHTPRSGTTDISNGSLRISFGPGERDIAIQGYRLQLAHPLLTGSDGKLLISQLDLTKLIDPILRPCYIRNREPVQRVVIDPGHGGIDPGAAEAEYREADLALSLALELESILKQKGYEVILTRRGNAYVSDRRRADIACGAADSVFISLHLNSGRSDMRGVQSYIAAPAAPGSGHMPGNRHDAANTALAFALHSAVIAATGAQDGSIRHARYSLLNSITHPAVIIEAGYATNPDDIAQLSQAAYRRRFAQAIADGLDAYAAAMKPDATLKVARETSAGPPSTYQEEAPELGDSADASSPSGSKAAEGGGKAKDDSSKSRAKSTSSEKRRSSSSRRRRRN
ncbi:MAG TPA: N-acetylmuramoyl-L-alanine amidase [Candidatus Akkermansia intestinigallinarum]|uniref:N-acetylmuramoyl-L-alanine amidase n=1 Tax=Candidatus Akkermansia intestinigallinarum TaxID=2838431 RepID=A0A9D1VBQ8_9BACT|nr:N-acetylmuramoyl-L-alanine amidase [Candidatus Akkermansia intestinigallinarum]